MASQGLWRKRGWRGGSPGPFFKFYKGFQTKVTYEQTYPAPYADPCANPCRSGENFETRPNRSPGAVLTPPGP